MPGLVLGGPRSWKGQSDEDGHREYRVLYLVQVAAGEGPAAAMSAVGLPSVGSPYLIDGESDPWAWCRPNASAAAHQEREGETAIYYQVEVTFSSKPLTRCGDTNVSNPLLEPYELAISYSRYSEEATHDRFGDPIVNSAWEQIRGPQAEFDASRATVRITFNTLSLNLALVSSMLDTVNSHVLWGMSARTIKFSNLTIDRKFYGTCLKYYRVGYEFEVRREGWDRDILDEGTKALNGKWERATLPSGEEVRKWVVQAIGQGADEGAVMPDRLNPSHFIRLTDETGNPVKMILNGRGVPYDPYVDNVDDCGECEDGAPRLWVIDGFPSSLAHYNLTLTHTSGCTWEGSATQPTEITFTLSYDEPTTTWELASNIGLQYSAAGAGWDCAGPNTLLRTAGGEAEEDAPASVEIRGPDTPGTVHIERYPESNFFLLGVPAILG
jgi:hypothetical protein